jgi:hypothetical protein
MACVRSPASAKARAEYKMVREEKVMPLSSLKFVPLQ